MNKNNIQLSILPKEILIGINTINAKTPIVDNEIYKVYGFELGFLFFKLSYLRKGPKVS